MKYGANGLMVFSASVNEINYIGMVTKVSTKMNRSAIVTDYKQLQDTQWTRC